MIAASKHIFLYLLYTGILIPFFNSGLFLVSMNMLIYNGLDYYFGIAFNIISFITLLLDSFMES